MGGTIFFSLFKKKKMKRKIFLYAWLLLMWIMGALSSWVVRAEEPTFTITTHCEFLHRWWDFLPDDLSEIPSSEPWGRCGHPITVVSWTTFNDVMRDNQDFCTINPAWFYSNGCEMNYVNDDNDRDKPITQDIDIYIEYWLGEILISFDANGWEWYRDQTNVTYNSLLNYNWTSHSTYYNLTNSFTRDWYTFTWWNTRPDWWWLSYHSYEVSYYEDEASYYKLIEDIEKNTNGEFDDINNMRLYAQREPEEYTITLDLNWWTWIETTQTIRYGENISLWTPTRWWYRFLWREPALPATMPGENLNVKATWKKKSSSTGWWSSSSSETNTGSTNTWTVNTWTINTWSNLTWDTQDSSAMPQNDDNVSSWANAKDPENNNGFTQEFIDAYNFAKKNWITTMPTIDQADMTWNLTRIQMAKMLSYYAINIMWKKPDETRNNKFNDVSEKLNSDYNSGVTLAYQLWIMWINMPNNNFRPNDLVTRWEFVTALSRMIYWTEDWEYENTNKYYTKHIEKLNEEEIIKQIDPSMKELRAYVMIMLKRTSKK